MSPHADDNDPVLQRRGQIARGVRAAKRAGYLALTLSIVAFGAAWVTGFPPPLVTASVVGLVASCVILPVPIVLGYGIRAAERDDRPHR